MLTRKVKKYAPRYLAIVGIGAYRTAFDRPKAKLGLQEETIGATRVWSCRIRPASTPTIRRTRSWSCSASCAEARRTRERARSSPQSMTMSVIAGAVISTVLIERSFT